MDWNSFMQTMIKVVAMAAVVAATVFVIYKYVRVILKDKVDKER